jgi:plasmid stabilization system protein ParE
VTEKLEHIAKEPLFYAEAEEGIREAKVPRFPYCIYFRVEPEQIVVLSIFHTSRDPEIWRDRE